MDVILDKGHMSEEDKQLALGEEFYQSVKHKIDKRMEDLKDAHRLELWFRKNITHNPPLSELPEIYARYKAEMAALEKEKDEESPSSPTQDLP